MIDSSENSDSDIEDLDIWNCRSKVIKNEKNCDSSNILQKPSSNSSEQLKDKFNELRNKRILLSENTKKRQQLTDSRIEAKKLKKAQQNSSTQNTNTDQNLSEWKEVKSFLNVNDHLHGPIKHGNCGPKTELEQKIDDAIEDGDFDQAEILSDNLANREFAVKINSAFAAKKYAEEMEKQETLRKKKNLKKLYWGFEAKNKWEMKGNM